VGTSSLLRAGPTGQCDIRSRNGSRKNENLSPAARGRLATLLNRDIIRLFAGLQVSDSFLLKNNLREILFRKPA